MTRHTEERSGNGPEAGRGAESELPLTIAAQEARGSGVWDRERRREVQGPPTPPRKALQRGKGDLQVQTGSQGVGQERAWQGSQRPQASDMVLGGGG